MLLKMNEQRIHKRVWTNNPKGEKVVIAKTGSDNDEARLVANTISDMQIKNNYIIKNLQFI